MLDFKLRHSYARVSVIDRTGRNYQSFGIVSLLATMAPGLQQTIVFVRSVSMQAHERAAQIWPILCLAAMNKQILTYKIIGGLIGVPHYALAQLLEPIQSYCLLRKLPALSVLVVNNEGRPGTGFIATENVPAEQQRVFRYDWQEEDTPLPDALLAAVRELPSNGNPEAAN